MDLMENIKDFLESEELISFFEIKGYRPLAEKGWFRLLNIKNNTIERMGVFKDINNEKMLYKGVFNPEELPNKLEGNLGLVWDGNYDESDEYVTFKFYTKYNNPHKLSCYIAAGLPVIVWNKSAIADFVRKYNIGYEISNLYEINNLDFSDYEKKKENVKDLTKKVRNGYFTRKIMKVVLNNSEYVKIK